MKTAALLAMLSLTAVACAAAPASNAASTASNETSGVAAATSSSTTFGPGKYVANGQILMIYGECSSQNFLGDAATGVIGADGVIPTPEGDVCLGYHLATTAPGEITVTWTQDPTAHLDNDTQKGCMSLQGTYLLMQTGSYVDPKPGTYANGAYTFVVPADCGTPAKLSSGDTDVADFSSTSDNPAGFLQAPEGDVCGGYSYTAQKDGSVKITWAPPAGASIVDDATAATDCKSVEGVYTAN